jgi:hypothetical protein
MYSIIVVSTEEETNEQNIEATNTVRIKSNPHFMSLTRKLTQLTNFAHFIQQPLILLIFPKFDRPNFMEPTQSALLWALLATFDLRG